MSKSLRWPEKWFRRGLWLVAVVFAAFLVGLGSLVVGDLPQVEQTPAVEDFIPTSDALRVKGAISEARSMQQQAERAQETAQLSYDAQKARYQAARETFDNWVATRVATARPEQDAELLSRTQALDGLKHTENQARVALEQQEQLSLQASQTLDDAQAQWRALEAAAEPRWTSAIQAAELRVFAYRLLLTLPLLALAGWLFVKKRKSTWWPFVWGFIFFALFTFFVELVPYLPSYGGYVRYIVGIVLTVLLGRAAILALNRYLEKMRLQESLPEGLRRQELSYDVALERWSKQVCPGCERALDLKDPSMDFCPHCGLGLFDHCGHCSARKNAFSRFCHACGTPAKAQVASGNAGESGGTNALQGR